jgi:hypothetical protein
MMLPITEYITSIEDAIKIDPEDTEWEVVGCFHLSQG